MTNPWTNLVRLVVPNNATVHLHPDYDLFRFLGDRFLGWYEPYLKLRRRSRTSPHDWPPQAAIPDYPRWKQDRPYNGWQSLYTRIGDEYYRATLSMDNHVKPPYRVDVAQWVTEKVTYTNPPTPSGTTTTNYVHVQWKELDHWRFDAIEEAEGKWDEVRENLTSLVMEHSL